MAWVRDLIAVFYTWTTVGENCSSCDALDGQVFEAGTEPGSHPNCDCMLVPTSIWDIYEESDAEPGIARLLTYTDLTGKKIISSGGLGPKITKDIAQPPKPTYYSNYQLDNL